MTISAADERAIEAAAKVMLVAGVVGEVLRQVTGQKINVAMPLMGTMMVELVQQLTPEAPPLVPDEYRNPTMKKLVAKIIAEARSSA